MSTEHPESRPTTDRWGVQAAYLDAADEPRRSPEASVARVREVIGEPPPDLEDRAPVVSRPGRAWPHGPAVVTCEDGTVRELGDEIPADFPLGYHRFRLGTGPDRRLVVSPGHCWLPDGQQWGWTVQLYAARSSTSWGIGDLTDLRALREWTAASGGGFVLVNPLHAVAPTLPQEDSPYLPATRRFRNPLYLHVPAVPGVTPADAQEVAEEVARVQELEHLDRDAVWRLKRAVLWQTWSRAEVQRDPELVGWRAEQGRAVEEFGAWCALAEEHGADWRSWPEELHDPGSPAVAAYVTEHPREVGFHVWLQWLLDRQLARATGGLTLLQDLPIGVSGSGADAWAWQDVLALGASVGAPPDALNSLGQDWGSPPLVPWRLRAADYEPFVQSVRRTIAGAGGLRIDHVMGLFRLWWIPEGAGAADGVYVRYPSDDLLDIVALESHRARAVVVGEDLGTVEPGVREALAERRILSYRVLWFEDEQPAGWPTDALAVVTTHDLPTVTGLWTGSDAEDQAASTGVDVDAVRTGNEELLARLDRSALAPGSTAREAVEAAYDQLAEAPSLLLSLALEDAVGQQRRPNVPGTTERANWRIPLPVPLEEVLGEGAAATLAARVDDRVRARRRRPGARRAR